MNNQALREELVSWGNRLIREGLVTGPGGNISARSGDIIYVSPSGYAFDELGPDDYVGVDLNTGQQVDGTLRPTSETEMHLGCYRKRPDVTTVFHTHPKYTIAMASAGHTLQAMCAEFHIYAGSHIPHVDYVTVTTPALAQAVEAVISDKVNVIVLRNHGAIGLGASMKQAYYRIISLEEGAQIQWLATQVGTPRFFTPQELTDLDQLSSEKFRKKLLES